MKIELTEQKSQLSIAVKKRANMKNLKALIDESYNKIYDYLTELKELPSGAPYVAYLGIGDEFDIEIGFPVDVGLPCNDDLYMSRTYEGKIVTGVYKGPYNGLEQAYSQIFEFINKNKLEPTGVYYDYYLNDPSITPEDELLTKIVVPVK